LRFCGPIWISANRRERPEEFINVPGLSVVLHQDPLHFDQRRWLWRIPARVVRELFDIVFELTELHAEPARQRRFGRETLEALALVFGDQDQE
jgi:hypothetical protein